MSAVDEYDPTSNTWTAKADMPIPRSDFASGVVGGQIYVMGGFSTSGSPRAVHAYDPSTDTWTTKADMPTPRDNVGAATLDGIIYVIGGQPATGGTLATVQAYDPASNTWTEKTPMPEGRLDLTAAAADGRIYAIGGVIANFPNVTVLSKVEEYDPTPSSVEDNVTGVPAAFVLHQNYPNPFNPATTIQFELSKPAHVALQVIDMQGHEIRTLIDEEQAPGLYQVRWDGTNDSGVRVASGVYLYRLESGELVRTRKLILMQ